MMIKVNPSKQEEIDDFQSFNRKHCLVSPSTTLIGVTINSSDLGQVKIDL
jgi:hypothetical protein